MIRKGSFIQNIILQRFRSIESANITFSNPTFLVGVNGSGKSNIIDAFSFLSDVMTIPLQAAFDKRGGIEAVRYRSGQKSRPGNFGLRITLHYPEGDNLSGVYAFEIRALSYHSFEVVREQCRVTMRNKDINYFERREKDFRTNVAGLNPAIERNALALPIAGGLKQFAPVLKVLSSMRVYSLEPGTIRELQDPDSGTTLRKDGSNITSVLQELERQKYPNLKKLYEFLNKIAPGTTNVRSIKHGKKLSLKFSQKWNENKSLEFEAFSMSDGTLRAVGLLAAVMQNPPPSLIGIEEPEATIHPGALGVVLDLIKYAAERYQIIISTHSPDILDAEWMEEDNIRVVKWEKGSTHIFKLGQASVSMLKGHLMGVGEMIRSNGIDTRPLFDSQDPSQLELFENI